MVVGIRKTGPAITQLDLAGFEKLLGVPLPADYGEFLLKYNGGRPKDHIIRNTERGDVDVKIFFGIRADEFYDIHADRKTMRNRMPSRFLSIATDDFGNRYCLSLGAPDYGVIYLWDHEEEADEGEAPTQTNLYHVSDSFSEFWGRMQAIDTDEYLSEMDRKLQNRDKPPRDREHGADVDADT